MRHVENNPGLARKAGPNTSKRAARKTRVGKRVQQIIDDLMDYGTSTAEEVWKRVKGNQTSLTSSFNHAMMQGHVVCIRRRGENDSGHKALLWRIAEKLEGIFLRRYMASLDQISADTLVSNLTKDESFLDWLEEHPKHQKRFRHYWKWVRFRVELRDKGILWFMDQYDNDDGNEWGPFVWERKGKKR